MRVVRALALGAIGAWVSSGRVALATPVAGSEAGAPRDFYLSLLGDSGVELFSDERVFALYAAFNALGYDAGPLARQNPIARPAFGPLRSQVRGQVQMSIPLQKRFQDFFDAHPLPRDAYERFVLGLGPSPTFTVAGGDLSGFEKLLAAHEAEAHVSEVYQKLAPQLRELLKGLLPRVDVACSAADKLLPLGTAAAAVAVNVLDEGSATAVVTEGLGVAGTPSAVRNQLDVSPILEAYAAARALANVTAHGAPKGVGELIARVQQRGLPAGVLSPTSYVAQAYAAAVAAQVLPAQRPAILLAADTRGLWLASDFDHLLMGEQGKAAPRDLPRDLFGACLASLATVDLKKVAPQPPAIDP